MTCSKTTECPGVPRAYVSIQLRRGVARWCIERLYGLDTATGRPQAEIPANKERRSPFRVPDDAVFGD
jgi:hypothetical protein